MGSAAKRYINLNGQLLSDRDAHIFHNNRSFCYGDSIFETIHTNGVNLHFFEDHFERLSQGMKVLKMETPLLFSQKYIEEEITGLIKRNRLFTGNRVRLSVFRNTGGYYTPTYNQVTWMAEVSPIALPEYKLNEKGLRIGIYDSIRKPVNILSSFKTGNSLVYIMAAIFKQENNLDDCLLINEGGNLVEAISSNIFLVKNRSLLTPPSGEGPVLGVLRKQIIRIARELKISVYEQELKPGYLLDADECFLTNTVSGISWVLGYKNKRYYNKVAADLLDELRKKMKTD
jgi:branched-subunit amino acid aminotransferase/4-amino-4-deoxychorismate lyase